MSDLAALLDKQAGAEITAILSEAQERASEITAAAQAEADAHVAAQERSARAQAEAALVRARSAAQLEAASVRLRSQHQAVEAVFDAVRAEFTRIASSDAWSGHLNKLLKGAAAAATSAGGKVASIKVNPSDIEAAKAAASELGLAAPVEADANVRLGVRVEVGETNVVIENSLVERLQSAHDDLAAEVSRLLSGSAGA